MFSCNNMARVMKLVLFFVVILSFTTAEPGLRTCEPIRVEMCMGLGYNKTGMPNYGDHERQSDAVITLRTFQPLIEYGCSAQLKFFLCSVFIPMCTDKVAQPIGPCRGLCEKVRSRCYPVLQGFGFPWPMALNCSRFPSENNHEHMCMEGPSEITTGFTSVTAHRYHMTPQGPTPCSKLSKSNQYSYINRSGRCVPLCNSDILFESADKSLAEVWLSIWAALCFVSTIVALLSFAVDSQTWGRYPENCLVFLTLCYALVSVGWSIRSAAGRTAVSCKPDESGGRLLMLTEDGLGNANCAVVFILLYYFGMAASVWWVVCCGCWVAVAALRWTQERLQGLSSLLHVVAWGVPAAHTLTVLVRREVVAEELTGICYAGGHNLQTLLWLVLVPHTGCLIIGVLLLITGAVLLSRRRGPDATRSTAGSTTTSTAVPVAVGSVARNRVKSQVDLLKIGVFALLNTIPLSCLVGSYAYEYWGRQSWLSGHMKPALWVFLLRIFMSLVVGITSCMWVWNPHTVTSWRQFLSRFLPRPGYHQPPVKQHPLPVLRYMPANHSAAHSQQLVGANQSALQPLTGGGTLPSGGRQARVHKHRAGSASGSGRGYHVRSGSETIL